MGSFGISEANITRKGGEKKTKKPQITCLTTTPSGEVAQTPTSATSKQGVNREVPAAPFRIGTRPECPEGNLRELT